MTNFPKPSEIDLVLYHANCPDGFGAAFAAWLLLGDKAEYIPCQYGESPPNVRGKNVAIVDFSFPRETLEELANNSKSLIVLDHHKTAAKDLSGFSNAIFDLNKSGAVLSYEWFHGVETVPLFFKYIQDRDLWIFELPHSKEFSAALSLRTRNFKSWLNLLEDMENEEKLLRFFQEGHLLCRFNQEELESLAKKAKIISLGGLEMWALNYSGRHHSDLGHVLCEKTPKDKDSPLGVSLTWFYDAENDIFRCSLRSSENAPSIRAIAESFGGGGHDHAAGFEWKDDIRSLLYRSNL